MKELYLERKVLYLEIVGQNITREGRAFSITEVEVTDLLRTNHSISLVSVSIKDVCRSMPILKELSKNIPITDLTLGCKQPEIIDSATAKALAGILPWTQITEFYLSFCEIGKEEAEILASILPSTSITRFELSGCNIDREGVKTLIRRLPSTRIAKFKIFYCSFDNETARALVDVLPRTRIASLELIGCDIGVEGANALARVLPSTRIKYLYLSSCNIGKEGAAAVADVLPNTRLQSLGLVNDCLGLGVVVALFKALPCSRLRELRIWPLHDIPDDMRAQIISNIELNFSIEEIYTGTDSGSGFWLSLPRDRDVQKVLARNCLLHGSLSEVTAKVPAVAANGIEYGGRESLLFTSGAGIGEEVRAMWTAGFFQATGVSSESHGHEAGPPAPRPS